ncbi:hypothetical protein [Ornithinimicrobium flavum]|uniref:hypothetical protein n=1 Tax=Ornithinimicrobium flavum TaxID=1288636 RepID=UPI0013051FC1|nr:hypothetical protein [Ornithinimicrobium flavum]
MTVSNRTDAAQVFTLSHTPAVSTSGTANDWFYTLWPAEVTHPETVTVPAGGSVDVPLVITSPEADEEEMSPNFGGYVQAPPRRTVRSTAWPTGARPSTCRTSRCWPT